MEVREEKNMVENVNNSDLDVDHSDGNEEKEVNTEH